MQYQQLRISHKTSLHSQPAWELNLGFHKPENFGNTDTSRYRKPVLWCLEIRVLGLKVEQLFHLLCIKGRFHQRQLTLTVGFLRTLTSS